MQEKGMIYIKTITIENFQSHRKSVIELDKGVNIIHGLSGAGKTAFIRAFRLLAYNRPSGAKFYSNFAGDEGQTKVDVRFSDDREIWLTKDVQRGKDRKKKLVRTTYETMDGSYSPGSDIPDEIRTYLNLGETNIQRQFDRPFLIFSAPGEIARTVNRITQLEEADGWKKDLSSKINKKKGEVDVLNEQSKAKELELAKYAGIEDLGDLVKKLESIDADFVNTQAEKFRLDESLVRIEKAEDKIKILAPVLTELADLARQIEGKEQSIREVADQRMIVESITRIDKQLISMRRGVYVLETLGHILLVESDRNELKQRLKQVESLDRDISSTRDLLDRRKKEYIEIVRKDKKCPVCFDPIDEKTIKRIEREL